MNNVSKKIYLDKAARVLASENSFARSMAMIIDLYDLLNKTKDLNLDIDEALAPARDIIERIEKVLYGGKVRSNDGS